MDQPEVTSRQDREEIMDMENCLGTPEDNHSPTTTKPFTDETSIICGSDMDSRMPDEITESHDKVSTSGEPRVTCTTYSRLQGGANVFSRIESDEESPRGRITTRNLKMFTLEELKSATRNFRPDTVLGEGGFGRVFKGWIDETTYAPSSDGCGMAVAVKKFNSDGTQGQEEWPSEVEFLGKFSHLNLVKLLGYCWEKKQCLLVYEYMEKGSLENHLFGKGTEPLPWNIRPKIAIGAARGLALLHTSERTVIYGVFKTFNILLDGAYNAKLSDFGLVKLGLTKGISHVITRIMGADGYAAPEYIVTGHLTVKCDVYGFGVVLLELLTGLQAVDTNRPTKEHSLVEWARPSLHDEKKLAKIMDETLEEQYPIKGAVKTAELLTRCLESDPKNRPSMEEVLESLIRISAIVEEPKVVPKSWNLIQKIGLLWKKFWSL